MQYIENNYDKVLYKVVPGDTLSKILQQYFGNGVSTHSQFQQYLVTIKQDNPQILDVDKIYPGQLILLRVPPTDPTTNSLIASANPDADMGMCNADTQNDPYESLFQPVIQNWQTMPKEEQDALQTLAPFYTSATIGIGAMTMTTSAIDSLFKSNAPALYEIRAKYEQYKNNQLTKGQYDYARRKILNRLQSNLGPVNRALYGNKKPHEVIRINRGGNAPSTGKITQQVNRLNKMSKIASKGGIVLSAVGLGVACHQVANAPTGFKKNEIMYESIGGLATGTIYGVGLSILLAGTPVGWVAALALGATGAGLSILGGKTSAKVYTSLGEEIDTAHFSTIDQLCTNIFIEE